MTWWWVGAALVLVPSPRAATRGGAGRRLPHRIGRAATADATIAWTLALVGELRAGADVQGALSRCSSLHGVGGRAARAARIGGDIPAALRQDAHGSALLASVAAAWTLAGQSGSGLADVLENLADGYRRSVAVKAALAVEMAGPRATARLMSLLPAVGVGLAMLLGADPVRWFVSSVPGLLCLTAGVLLNVAGYSWIGGIVRGVEADL